VSRICLHSLQCRMLLDECLWLGRGMALSDGVMDCCLSVCDSVPDSWAFQEVFLLPLQMRAFLQCCAASNTPRISPMLCCINLSPK
jgi:hypothetical protein